MGVHLVELAIRLLRVDGGTQARARTDQGVVNDYAEYLRAGAPFPPAVAFYDGTTYLLADGFHRRLAHLAAGRKTMLVDVRQGTLRDATLFAVGANAQHGLRRTNEDKRHAVLILLRDAEWGKWAGREIARRCGVSDSLVRVLREQLSARETQIRVSRGGTTYTMDAAAIGASLEQQETLALAERSAADRAQARALLMRHGSTLYAEAVEVLGPAEPALGHLDAFLAAVRGLPE